MGTWTVTSTGTNGAAANQWYISNSVVTDVVTCNPSLGNATLHIGPSVAGVCATVDCDAVYNDGAANITDLEGRVADYQYDRVKRDRDYLQMRNTKVAR
jgi:hypothetical protein